MLDKKEYAIFSPEWEQYAVSGVFILPKLGRTPKMIHELLVVHAESDEKAKLSIMDEVKKDHPNAEVYNIRVLKIPKTSTEVN